MRKLILFISVFVSIIPVVTFSQYDGITVTAGGAASTLKMEGLSSFFTSYNDFFSPSIDKGFSNNFSLLKGYSFRVGYTVGDVFDSGIGVVENFGRNTVKFNNGDKHILKFKQRDYLVDMSIGSSIVAVNLGIMMSYAEVRMYYSHNNGVKDYHSQYTLTGKNSLNGLYDAWSLSFYTGLRVGIPLDDNDAFRLILRGDYVFKPTGGVDFRDNEPSKQSTVSFSGGREFLPSNVDEYFNGSNAANVYNSIKNENSHLRLMFCIQVNLGEL